MASFLKMGVENGRLQERAHSTVICDLQVFFWFVVNVVVFPNSILSLMYSSILYTI